MQYFLVPPNIDDDASSSDVLVREFNSETLKCKATGLPTPHIKWRRTGGRKIKVNGTFGCILKFKHSNIKPLIIIIID